MSVRNYGNRFAYASLLAFEKGQNIAICHKNPAATFLLWETGIYSELLTSF